MDTCTLEARIEHLAAASLAEVKREWVEVLGKEPPKGLSRKFMVRVLAFELQVWAQPRKGAKVRRQLMKLQEQGGVTAKLPKQVLAPGGRLIREWHGVAHQVDLTEEGYRWEGRTYRSLSGIAREITGTRWNGPLFFGLRGNKEIKAA